MRFAFQPKVLPRAIFVGLIILCVITLSCAANKNDLDLEFANALEAGDAAKIHLLLGQGAALDSRSSRDGLTPLHWAVLSEDGDLAALVIERILKTKQSALLDERDAHGFTPLMWAAGDGDYAALQALVQAGADLNLQSPSGNTALHYAITSGRPVSRLAMRRLLDAGAHTRITNDHGDDPYAIAGPDMRAVLTEARHEQ
jgi:ankyrin repeat protein